MGFWILIIVSLLVFAVTIPAWKRFRKTGLFVMAVGGASAANVYNIESYPIVDGPFIFGVDAIAYTLFLFCVLLMYLEFGKRSARNLVLTTMVAIGFTAIMQFFASWGTGLVDAGVWWSLISFSISIVSTYVVGMLMLWMFRKLESKKLNIFANIALSVLVGSLLNSLMYFGFMAIIGKLGAEFGWVLLSSYLAKFMAIGLSVLTFYLGDRFWKKKPVEQNIDIQKQKADSED